MKKIGFWLFIVLSISPLIYLKKYDFGYHTPKILFFWFVIIAFALVKSFKYFSTNKISFSLNHLGVCLLTYLTVLIASGFNAQSPSLSFFSTFERMDGIINYIFLIVFYLLLSNEKIEIHDWQRILKFSTAIAIVISLIAIIEFHKDDFVRAKSTFANPLTLAYYLVFHFLLVFSSLIDKLTNQSPYKSIEKLVTILILFIIGYGIFTTSARSAIISLLCGIITLGIYSLVVFKGYRKKILILFGIISSLGITVIVKISSLTSLMSRIGDFSLLDNSSFTRIALWKTVFTFWKDKPFLGWGKEHFVYFFTTHYQNSFHNSDEWYDRSHNFLIDKFLESGILGLVSYCLIISVSILSIFKRKNHLSPIQEGALLAFIVSFISFHFTNFETYSSYIIIFSIFIFITQHSSAYQFTIRKNLKITFSACFVILIFSGYQLVFKTFQNYKTWNNIKLTTDNIYFVNQYDDLLSQAKIGKYDILLKFGLSRSLIPNNRNLEMVKDDYYKKAESNFKNALKDYPEHPILLSQLGFIQFESGNSEEAIKTYLHLKEIAPYRHTNILDLGTMYMMTKQYDKALAIYDYVLSYDDMYQITYLNKAYCLALIGDKTNAAINLKKLSPKIIIDNQVRYDTVKQLL